MNLAVADVRDCQDLLRYHVSADLTVMTATIMIAPLLVIVMPRLANSFIA
jgi:hypothetical protein